MNEKEISTVKKAQAENRGGPGRNERKYVEAREEAFKGGKEVQSETLQHCEDVDVFTNAPR